MLAAVLTAEQFTALDETRRADYRQNGEIYELQIDGFDAHSAVTGLKRNNAAILKEKKTAADEAAAYKALGVKPEEIAQWKQERTEQERKKLEEEGRYQDIIRQATDAHASEKQALVDEHTNEKAFLERVLHQNLITRAATEAIISAGGNEYTVALLLPHVERQLKATPEGEGDDRDYTVRVVGANGLPRVKNGSAEFMDLKDLAVEMKASKNFQPAFPATGAGGGGATNGTSSQGKAGARTITRSAFQSLDPTARMQFVQEGGLIKD